jgi:site-specific recombinase XerD
MTFEGSNVVPFPSPPDFPWIDAYRQACLTSLEPGTVAVYTSILRNFTGWLLGQTRKRTAFHPDQITTLVIRLYFADLVAQGYSRSHCQRARGVIVHFCQWLVDDKAVLKENPARGITIAVTSPSTSPTRASLLPPLAQSPRPLSPQQRALLQRLVEKDDLRGQALFALGYWAGCHVKEITHLLLSQTHIGAKSGWLRFGESEEKSRDIDLCNEARRALYAYLQHRNRDETSPYVFLSQRGERLTEAGLHHWFRALKACAKPDEQAMIAEIRFQDVRNDFVHRVIETGWTLEEVTYYVGNITNIGTLSLQTPVRYIQVTRAQIREKLRTLKQEHQR